MDDEDAHAPWHYTEYGVLCSCGAPMDSGENCLWLAGKWVGAVPEEDE